MADQPSRWARPGLDRDERDDTVDDFGDDFGDVSPGRQDSKGSDESQLSQGTFPLGSSAYETESPRAITPPPPPPSAIESRLHDRNWFRRILAITIPASMLAGAFLAWLVLRIL
jgi:hypothetical protein